MAKNKRYTVEAYSPANDPHGDMAIELAWELIFNIRDDDERELEAVGDPVFEIYSSLYYSAEAYIYRDREGMLLGIVGMGKSETANGRCVWMMGTKMLKSFVKDLLFREARRLVRKWVNKYGKLYSCVYSKNTKSVGWLRMLGAEFSEVPIKREDKTFYYFEIRKARGVRCAV